MGSTVLLTINHLTYIHLWCDSKTSFFSHLIFKDRVKFVVAVEEQRWAVPPCLATPLTLSEVTINSSYLLI